jgi:hypothetical protein
MTDIQIAHAGNGVEARAIKKTSADSTDRG